MSDRFYSPTGKIWTWNGLDASDEEFKKWSAVKKIIALGYSDKAFYEVFSENGLNELHTGLTNDGWIGQKESPRLTLWVKSTNQ